MCVFLEKIIVLSALLFRVFVGLSWEKYCIIRTIVSNICMAFLRKLLYYPNLFCENYCIIRTIVLCRLSWENYCIIRTVVTSICEAFLRKMLYYSTYCTIIFEAFLRKLLYYPNCFYEYLWGFPKKTIVLSELLLRLCVRLSWENYCIIRTVVTIYLWGFLEKTIVLSELLFQIFVRLSCENYCIIRTTVTIMCKARKLLYYELYGDYEGFLEKTIVLSELLLRFVYEKTICEAFLRKLLYYPNYCFKYLWRLSWEKCYLFDLLLRLSLKLSWENYCIIRTVVSSICEGYLRKVLHYPNYVRNMCVSL